MRDFWRLLKTWRAGAYPNGPWRTTVLFAVLIVYVISPIDILPDYIPFIGVVDDLSLLGVWFASMRRDLKKFRAWEEKKDNP